jgi:hypothetical protein
MEEFRDNCLKAKNRSFWPSAIASDRGNKHRNRKNGKRQAEHFFHA